MTSLADLLPSALAVLGVPGSPDRLGLRRHLDGVRRIAVLLVDGLGYHLLPLAAPLAPALADVVAGRLGTLTELASPFPSTTPVSLVTLGTGTLPGAHGVLGFVSRIPGTDRLLNHIEWQDDPAPAVWQPLPTQFAKAGAAGVTVSVASRAEYAGTGLTVAAYRGAPYRNAGDIVELAAQVLAGLTDAPALSYGYHPALDSTGHVYGVDSEQWRVAAAEVDALVTRIVDGLPADAALLVTADHGQLDIPADQRYDVDTDPRLSAGIRLVAGEPRVRYLHTEPGAVPDVIAAWRAVLGAGGWVGSREEAIDTGWYGPVAPGHEQRIGDAVAICRAPYAVLATRREKPSVAKLVAFHGADTPVETAVPLIVVRGGH